MVPASTPGRAWHVPVSLTERLREFLAAVSFVSLRFETHLTACAGLAAVQREESRTFPRHGLTLAPWPAETTAAQAALATGAVVPLDGHFTLALGPGCTRTLRVLAALLPGEQPILFLDVEGCFRGRPFVYDTPELGADALVFGLAVEAVLRHGRLRSDQWIWGADWETAPALLLLQPRHLCALHLHNIFDRWLGDLLPRFTLPAGVAAALERDTVLAATLPRVEVVAGVNRGFCRALTRHPIYTHVLAPHLQPWLGGIVPVENANFGELPAALVDLHVELGLDRHKAGMAYAKRVATTRRALPAGLPKIPFSSALVLVMGRRAVQKGFDVAIAAIRGLLAANPRFSGYFFFATLPGDGHSDRLLAEIRALHAAFPRSVGWSDGRLAGYAELAAAANFILMPSLYEPHGGCFSGTAVPIASGEGPEAQIAGWPLRGAAVSQRLWHGEREPSGFAVSPPLPRDPAVAARHLRELLDGAPVAGNPVFGAMVAEFTHAIAAAVELWRDDPPVFAGLVREALGAQQERSWAINYGGMFSHVAAAQARRGLQ